jgi:hypothetical protein
MEEIVKLGGLLGLERKDLKDLRSLVHERSLENTESALAALRRHLEPALPSV